MPNPKFRESLNVEVPIFDRQVDSLETASAEVQRMHGLLLPQLDAFKYPEIGSKRLAHEINRMMEKTTTAFLRLRGC